MGAKRSQIRAIVEGHGEQRAVPGLLNRYFRLRKLYNFCTPDLAVRAAGNGALLRSHNKEHELGIEHYVEIAGKGPPAGILIILDAEGECLARARRPGQEKLGPELLRRAKAVAGHIPISVVAANRTYESWFMAAFEHLQSAGAFPATATPPDQSDIEGHRHKSRIAALLGRKYEESIDMLSLTRHLPLVEGTEKAAQRSRSFKKLL